VGSKDSVLAQLEEKKKVLRRDIGDIEYKISNLECEMDGLEEEVGEINREIDRLVKPKAVPIEQCRMQI
jgi:hypothetical protein